ncbi:MAG TPA: ATP-binding protein [Gaiellaceae bacterium]|jgi:K+-sensing histidine kinase KdpD|nr:ATP-binding protein [Gaiellaceae bacterium]
MQGSGLSGTWARRVTGILLSVIAVALVTGAVFALRPVAPVLSLGVLYVVAVVAVAVLYGLAYAIPVSVASMLTFNFLFLPPVHTLALHDSANWVALAVYIAVAVVVSELATRSRRLAREAVEAETLRQSDAVKTAVLRAVSHDLRSPLTAIRTASEGLDNPAFELSREERDGLFETIRIEVGRLERLVDNLLDLSRLEAGPALRKPELWTIDTLLARALEQLGVEADRVEVMPAPDLGPIRVDATHVERVLVNLLENALKFSSPTDPVEVSAAAEPGRIVVRVRDRGSGVAEADRERIFDAFERGNGVGGGTGLGLAIARGFAEANGGRVWVEPAAATSGGSTFVLALPAVVEGAVLPQ